jgi:ArsR family transcriptional regulator, cadmium/lead-responsive transcriptional repressor
MPQGRPSIIELEPIPLADTELVARLFRALGDSTRLRILKLLLEEGELHQMEIVRRLGATQARVSEHMACLTWCGFVDTRNEGRKTLYRVANRQVRGLIERAKRFLEQNEAQIASCRRIDPTRGNN